MSYLKLDDYTVPGHGLKVTSSFEFKSQDISGSASSTAKAGQGTKAKIFSVQLFIKYSEAESLRKLIEVAETKGSIISAKDYTITNDTANAMGVKKVSFTGKFSVDEQDSQSRWLVSFTLYERSSNAEMIQSRIDNPLETLQDAASMLSGGASVIEAVTSFLGGDEDKAGAVAGVAAGAAGSGADVGLQQSQKVIHKVIGPEDYGTY